MKILKNYRYYVLLILGAIGLIGLLSAPSDELTADLWFAILVATKVTGIAFLYLAAVLYIYWRRAGKISSLNELIKEQLKK